MSNSSNNVIYLAIASMFLLAGMLLPVPAAAQGLSVDFEDDPLFDVGNFLPGDEEIKTIDVENGSDAEQSVYVSTTNVENSDNLGDKLRITIDESENSIYNGSLSNFFNDGQIPLSDLSAGADTTYTFTVEFESATGNAYQGKMLGFDLCIGFEGGQISCGDTQENDGAQDEGGVDLNTVGGAGPPAGLSSDDSTTGENDRSPNGPDVAGVATSTEENDLSGPLNELEEALRGLLLALPNDDDQSNPEVAGASTQNTSPGLPNTGTGSEFGRVAVALSLLLLVLAIACNAFIRLYRVFRS